MKRQTVKKLIQCVVIIAAGVLAIILFMLAIWCRGKRGERMSHRYYSPLRPLSLGTFPKPQGNEILHIENFEERQNVPEIAQQAWGYIEYKEALTEIEAAAYELIPSNCIFEMENIEARR